MFFQVTPVNDLSDTQQGGLKVTFCGVDLHFSNNYTIH